MAVGNLVKRLQDIMRKDAGINGDAQRIEQMVWMFFLKVYDAAEEDWELDAEDMGETYKSITGSWVDVTTLGDTVHPSKSKDTLTKGADSANEAKFTFAGLDDGYYRLVETVTPQGYNTLDITYFEITANHTVTGLTSLTGTDGVSFTMTPVLATAELDAEIENNQGTELPSTGGIGTTIFYVAGIVLVLGAAAIIIACRKAEQN